MIAVCDACHQTARCRCDLQCGPQASCGDDGQIDGEEIRADAWADGAGDHGAEWCGKRGYDADDESVLDDYEVAFAVRHCRGNRAGEHGEQRGSACDEVGGAEDQRQRWDGDGAAADAEQSGQCADEYAYEDDGDAGRRRQCD